MSPLVQVLRSPDYVIAASNASFGSKAAASASGKVLGAGENAAAALQTAFNEGRPIRTTEGAYPWTSKVVVPATWNHRWLGAGWSGKFTAGGGLNDHMLEFSTSGGNVTGAKLAEVWLDHDASSQTTGCPIYAKGAVECEFDHLRITEPYDAGIWFHEISSGNVGHHNRTRSCLFEAGSSSAGAGQGIRYQASDENYSDSDSFNEMGGASGDAYAIKDWAGLQSITKPHIVGGKGGILHQDCANSGVVQAKFDRVTRHAVSIAGSSVGIQYKTTTWFRGGDGTATNTYSSVVLDGTGYHQIDGRWWSGTNPTHNTWLRSLVRFLGAGTNFCRVTGTMEVGATLGTGKIETNAQTGNVFQVANYP